MKTVYSIIIAVLFFIAPAYPQTRNVVVGTNSAVISPTNFWSADAANARSGLGLGTAATNPSTAFQPSSSVLTNLANNNGTNLTNIPVSGVVGALSTNGSASSLTNFPTLNQNTTGTASNVTGVVAITNGGTGASNVSNARLNLGATTVGNAVFTATNAEAARTAMSLGTAATSDVTAFQPASANLTNLSTNNGASLTGIPISGVVNLQSNLDTKLATNGNASGLTNITAANITGTVALATNVTGVVAIANGGTAGTNASSARSSLGATTVGGNLFTLANPDDTRFIRLNANNTVSALSAADMRTALSVGTNSGTVTSVGLTVPSFLSVSVPTITSSGTFAITLNNQTSRQLLIAPNGGGIPAFRALESDDLPSLAISKITGLQTAIDGKLSTTGTAALATNVTGIVALANGGTGGTNAASARSGIGATTVGGNIFTIPNPSAVRFLRMNADNTVSALSDSDFRTALSLGTAATNPSTSFQSSSTNLTTLSGNNGVNLTNIPVSGVVGALATNGNGAGLTNLTAANITGTVALASNVSGIVAIANGGTGATNAATARTNLGLGATWLTNTNSAFFRDAIGLGSGNDPEFNSVTVGSVYSTDVATDRLDILGRTLELGEDDQLTLYGGGLAFSSTTNAAITRTNLGIPWSGLTNQNAATFQTALFGVGTNPVLVNTNGDVVSPTNFWQAAPITTTFIESQPTTNSTTNITAARFLHIHSLNTNIVNVTNTIALPTNGSTFNGDIALVVHQGPTNSTTRVRAAGSTNDIATMTRYNEAIEFVYYNNNWTFNHNQAFTEPVYFAGTNAAGHAAESRTNLGLGTTNNVAFSNIVASGTLTSTGVVTVVTNLNVGGAIAVTNAAATRTNLGIPLAALTNTSNTNFQAAIFATNSTPTNVANVNAINFNTAVAWMGVTVVTNGVTNTFRIPLFQ